MLRICRPERSEGPHASDALGVALTDKYATHWGCSDRQGLDLLIPMPENGHREPELSNAEDVGSTGAAPGGRAGGRRAAPHRRAARQGQADRARAHRPAARSRLVRGMGHVRRASLRPISAWRSRRSPATAWSPAMARSTAVWSSSSARTSPCSAARCRKRMPRRSARSWTSAMKVGAPVHRPQRLRRRPHPGRCRLAGRLCRGVPAQRDGLRRRPADLADHGAVRRRRGLFAGHDRLHLHGEGQLLHVRDRSRRGEDRDARDRDPRGTGRRRHPYREVGRRRSRVRERRRGAAAAPPLHRLPAASNREKPPVRPTPIRSTATISRSTRWCRPIRTSPTT